MCRSRYLNDIKEMKTLNEEQLFENLGQIFNDLEEDGYHQHMYDFGKLMYDELIERGDIPDWEVENSIRQNRDDNGHLYYAGIYNLYAEGEKALHSVLPDLIKVLENQEEGDLVLEETATALIKIGTSEVVQEVEKIALLESTCFYSIV